jgi:prepilin-type N-terminal cleavage/methylation domain-containing protein/prepilin-type processing-associated H-X9-DG protein
VKKNRAFTLIELLVVIAIIAILAAILFPVFARAKATAKKAADISNMKQHLLGILMYAGDYDDMMVPTMTSPAPTFVDYNWNTDFTWPQLIMPYQKSWGIHHNPADGQATDQIAYNNWLTDPNYDNPQANTQEREFYLGISTSYGMNYMAWAPMNAQAKWTGVAMTSAGSPADSIMLANSIWDKAAPRSPIGGGNWFVEAPHWAFSQTNFWFGGWNLADPSDWLHWGGVYDFHNEVANIGFGDGHAKSFKAPALLAGVTVVGTTITGVYDQNLYLWDAGY